MEYDDLDSKPLSRQFFESCIGADDHFNDEPKRHISSSTGARVKISDSSISRTLHRGDRGLRVGAGKEKKVRRQIANSNERKRMQSINDGFLSLKALLPQTDTGEKLSKATILQHAANYIAVLLDERKKLLAINTQCMLLIGRQNTATSGSTLSSSSLTTGSASHKRRKSVTESSDEGISMVSGDHKHPRSRGRDCQPSGTSASQDRPGNKRLKRVAEETAEVEGPPYLPPPLPASGVDPICTQQTSMPCVSSASAAVSTVASAVSTDRIDVKPSHSSEVAWKVTDSMPQKSEEEPTAHSTIEDCSVSRRNLATIFMAIRHLEGNSFEDMDDKVKTEVVEVKPFDGNVGEEKEVGENCGIKRRWQVQWEKCRETSESCGTRKPEGVMKLKDRLLRKRQLEMEQLAQRLHQDQPKTEPQPVTQSSSALPENHRLLKHLISTSNNNLSLQNADSLILSLSNDRNVLNNLSYSSNEAMYNMGNGSMRNKYATVSSDLTLDASNFLQSSELLLSSMCRPIILNAELADCLSPNSVSRC